MKAEPQYFLIDLPGTGTCLTWIGGPLIDSPKLGKVWLTNPAGEPVMECRREQVKESSPEETSRLLEEMKWRKTNQNHPGSR